MDIWKFYISTAETIISQLKINKQARQTHNILNITLLGSFIFNVKNPQNNLNAVYPTWRIEHL